MRNGNGGTTPKDSAPAKSSPDCSAVITHQAGDCQRFRTIWRCPIGHLIGNTVAVMDEAPGRTVVYAGGADVINGKPVLTAPPEGDGWARFTRYFYPRDGEGYSRSASTYARQVYQEISLRAARELAYRHRRDAARQAEREAREGGGQ